MLANKVFLSSTSWVYDVTTGSMAALRGHKYHILPTSAAPVTIALTLFLLLLTFVFNFHGSKLEALAIDRFISTKNHLFLNELFATRSLRYHTTLLDQIIIQIDPTISIYTGIHIFWLAPFFLTLGVFFLWSSSAIVEGATAKVSAITLYIDGLFIAAQILIEPLYHSTTVWKGFKIGFIIFIISEIMFFFGFFWGFFHSSISPTIQIGAVWPPIDVDFITVKGFAIANTVILLTSGATLTVAHYAFELIPQKKTWLEQTGVPFTSSVESFEERLTEKYFTLNAEFFKDAPLPEIYPIPFFNYLRTYEFTPIPRVIASMVIPVNIFFNPLKRFFTRNYSLLETELTVKLYINLMLDATLLLALLFMTFQGTEYFISTVSINTGIYGSTFYMITGLHGAHVFIGTCFLLYCRLAVAPAQNIWAIYLFFYNVILLIIRAIMEDKTKILSDLEQNRELNWSYFTTPTVTYFETNNNIEHYGKFGIESFESAAWYWHFVDVVWIFVFGFVYVWSHLTVLDQQ
jgi:heme/copper-type cytochrome/quinol oxidase subunit 3